MLFYLFVALFFLLGCEMAGLSAKNLLYGLKKNDEVGFKKSRRFEKFSKRFFLTAYGLLATQAVRPILAFLKTTESWPSSDFWADSLTYGIMAYAGLMCLIISSSSADKFTEWALGRPLGPMRSQRDSPWRVIRAQPERMRLSGAKKLS